MKPVKVNAKYQITLPRAVREKLNIRAGDRLLLDLQDGVIVLIPELTSYAEYLQGLHSGIGKDVDVKKYLDGERGAWSKIELEIRR